MFVVGGLVAAMGSAQEARVCLPWNAPVYLLSHPICRVLKPLCSQFGDDLPVQFARAFHCRDSFASLFMSQPSERQQSLRFQWCEFCHLIRSDNRLREPIG